LKSIFVIDDSDTNLSMAETVLEDKYNVMTMPSAAKMFSLLDRMTPDLILLDIEMPEMNGFTALQKLKLETKWSEIPVIFLTGRNDTEAEARGLELGAVDFITKPFSAPVFLNRIRIHLDINEIILERTRKLNHLKNSIISVLADIVENRDKGTGEHIERTSTYIKILIDKMKEQGVYSDEINKWDEEKVISSARMHDIGKISITDLIINKPGRLTEEEYELMKAHVKEGERIIDKIIERTEEEDFLRHAWLFASAHHEHWDGKGYPRGLKGEEIPLHGRIMAIVDVYDALVSERPYKKALPAEEAVRIIMEGAGTHFDPNIVKAFFETRELFKSVTEG